MTDSRRRDLLDQERETDRVRDARRAQRNPSPATERAARPQPARTSRAADRDRHAERASRFAAERRRRLDQATFFDMPAELRATGDELGVIAGGDPRVCTRDVGAAVSDPRVAAPEPRAVGSATRARPRSGPITPRVEVTSTPEPAEWAHVVEPPPERGRPGRATVTITGRGAEGYTARRGTRPSTAQRHQSVRLHERDGFRPDRVALWAVMLGVMLMLAAAASSHAAVLAHHVLAH